MWGWGYVVDRLEISRFPGRGSYLLSPPRLRPSGLGRETG